MANVKRSTTIRTAKRFEAKCFSNLQRYIIYYTKNPEEVLGDWEKTSVGGDQLEITIPADEDTPYNVRIQAATKDGAGIISEAYDVTTGKKRLFYFETFLYRGFFFAKPVCWASKGAKITVVPQNTTN